MSSNRFSFTATPPPMARFRKNDRPQLSRQEEQEHEEGLQWGQEQDPLGHYLHPQASPSPVSPLPQPQPQPQALSLGLAAPTHSIVDGYAPVTAAGTTDLSTYQRSPADAPPLEQHPAMTAPFADEFQQYQYQHRQPVQGQGMGPYGYAHVQQAHSPANVPAMQYQQQLYYQQQHEQHQQALALHAYHEQVRQQQERALPISLQSLSPPPQSPASLHLVAPAPALLSPEAAAHHLQHCDQLDFTHPDRRASTPEPPPIELDSSPVGEPPKPLSSPPTAFAAPPSAANIVIGPPPTSAAAGTDAGTGAVGTDAAAATANAADADWAHGLCDCGDPGVCCTSLACPCVTYGRTQYRLGRLSAGQEASNLLGYSVCNGTCTLMAVLCGCQCMFFFPSVPPFCFSPSCRRG